MPLKVAYVTPRYGDEVLGGAEYAARMLAERLVTQKGFAVEVFTTLALDSATWAPHYAPGEVDVNGVTVRRFANQPRHKDFPMLSDKVLPRPQLATILEAEQWISWQGPTSTDLVTALGDSDADVVCFYPYLYDPTVRGISVVGDRAVMHPAAHDEAPLRLPVFFACLLKQRGFVFQTDGERRLVEDLFHVADKPQISLGLGVDVLEGDESGFRSEYGLDEDPYVLCLGTRRQR